MVGAIGEAVAAAGLALLLWAACDGVGAWILPRETDDRTDDAVQDWNRPGVAACIGLGVLLALGGLGMALHLPVWLTLGPFLVVGLTTALVRLLGLSRRAVPWAALMLSGLTVGAFVLVALVQSQVGLRAQLNPCDELRAYLPMVHRLLDTGAVIEPWSYRRLQNLGGFTYLQAVHVSLFGDIAIGVAEFLIASVFLGGLFVASGFRAAGSRIACLLFILAIPVLWIPRINTAPVLLTVPLLVAAYAATTETRRALRSGDRTVVVRWSIAVGVLLAGIASVRTPTMPVAAAVVAIGALTASPASIKRRIWAVATAAGAALVSIGPWLIAAWESVGTPLYPLISGNANTAVPSERDPAINTLGELASDTMHLVRSGSLFWVALAIVALAVIARKVLPDAWLVAIIAIATLLAILVFSVTLSIASTRDFGRYIAPMVHALVVFLFYETLRALDARAGSENRPALTGAITVGVAVGLLLVFSPVAVRTTGFSRLLPASWELLDWSSPAYGGFTRANRITPPEVRTQYERALEHIDPQHTIVAVDRPYLVDYERFDLPNMDFPGWAAPAGTFPFFRGVEPKIAALERQGFTRLIATEPNDERCLIPTYLYLTQQGLPPDSIYARYFLDWENGIVEIERDAPGAVTKYGQVLVIDLPKARAVLSQRALVER